MKTLIIVFSSVFLSFTAQGEVTPSTEMFHTLTTKDGRVVKNGNPNPKTYNLKTKKKPEEVTGKLEPNRLYLRFEPSENKMVLDITGPDGLFPQDPRRALVPPCSVPGAVGGGAESVWYMFNGDKKGFDAWEEVPNPGVPGNYQFVYYDNPDPKKRSVGKPFHSTKRSDR